VGKPAQHRPRFAKRLISSDFSNEEQRTKVEVVATKVRQIFAAPLLLQPEKEKEDEAKLLNSEQNVEECDLAPPKLREGAAQPKPNRNSTASKQNTTTIKTKSHYARKLSSDCDRLRYQRWMGRERIVRKGIKSVDA
jgi:hypothetical protein